MLLEEIRRVRRVRVAALRRALVPNQSLRKISLAQGTTIVYKITYPHSFLSSPQAQTIIIDVSQPLDEIQAPRDFVKSTAIALVKQDSVFLPGTTIGATHWVAYAMTRGT